MGGRFFQCYNPTMKIHDSPIAKIEAKGPASA